ncbi:helix-turn-helix domain-containing protein [Thiolinea disciformis]|uniref:helix-turn-helix domain-containing protein n=1 Tax=Thiolinea disciformis TaxID=125614 RepID=UPI0003659F37
MNTVSTPISVAIKIAGSQGKLAKMIGVHQTAISHFFLGRKRPSPEVAMRLQNAVNNQFQWYEFIGIEQGATQQEPQKNGSTDDASDTAQTSDGHVPRACGDEPPPVIPLVSSIRCPPLLCG